MVQVEGDMEKAGEGLADRGLASGFDIEEEEDAAAVTLGGDTESLPSVALFSSSFLSSLLMSLLKSSANRSST